MRLEYTSQKGRFNWANTSEESIRCHISVYDDGGEVLLSTSVEVDYLIDGCDVDEAIWAIQEDSKRVWFSTREESWNKMVKFLEENRKAIDEGNRVYRIEEIKKQMERLRVELEGLEAEKG